MNEMISLTSSVSRPSSFGPVKVASYKCNRLRGLPVFSWNTFGYSLLSGFRFRALRSVFSMNALSSDCC